MGFLLPKRKDETKKVSGSALPSIRDLKG